MNSRRGISYMLKVFIAILIVLIAAAIYAAIAFGIISIISVPAKLAVVATAQSVPDGAIVTLNIWNTGTNSANIVAVLVKGATSAYILTNESIVVGVTNTEPSPSDYPNTNGLVIPGGAIKSIQLVANGVVQGSRITVYVVYYDLVTGVSNVTSVVANVM